MSVSQELITKHFLLSGTKRLKPVMPKSHENQILTLITLQIVVQSWIVQVFHVLAPGEIIGNFTIFEG